MLRSSRDSLLLELNKISSHEYIYEDNEQLIFHLITQMQGTDKFIAFAATKALYSVLISSKELAVHSVALTGLFSDIQAAFMHRALFVEFSLELISKMLKRFQRDQLMLSGVCQLYFECVLKLWPVLLELQMCSTAVSVIPFVSLIGNILKFKFDDTCNYSTEERSVLSIQTSVVDICTHKLALPQLLILCRNLYEMKKCLGLFTRLCASKFPHDRHSLCSTLLDSITSSSLLKSVVCNWLLLPSQSVDIHYIRGLFNISPVVGPPEGLIGDDTNLLASVVRKLAILIMKSLSVMADGGKGDDWLYQFEHMCKISSDDKKCVKSLRNILLEILLDHDGALMNALCYCLTITRNTEFSSGSVIANVLDVNLLFIKFLCAISYDHVVLMDYVISDETCFVEFLACYLEYAYDNWLAFTTSHLEQDVMKGACSTNETGTSLSRKRKRQTVHCSSCTQDQSHTLVPYDLSDSSDEGNPVEPLTLRSTMSCIIRLRLALDRMMQKQIMLNSQAPVKLVSVIERLETLYETSY